jgi:hypothetical protein
VEKDSFVKITKICPNLSCMPTPTFENVLLRKRNAKLGVGGNTWRREEEQWGREEEQ